MNKLFEVSVIIPVYNAEKYIIRAVNSALDQPEVREVILVDDGFPDGAYDLCLQITKKNSRVKLLTHHNNVNLGASVSRNLGMLNASSNYISFLDADDFFLQNRFKFTKEVFESDPLVMGVYEPVGTEFSSNDAKKLFCEMMQINAKQADGYVTYPKNAFVGKEFFEAILMNTELQPLTSGISINKELLSQVGLFNPNLRLHQDTEFWVRLSYSGYFSTPSNRIPVAIRTMHEQNRIYTKNNQSKLNFYKSLLAWATQFNIDKKYFNLILATYQDVLKNQRD